MFRWPHGISWRNQNNAFPKHLFWCTARPAQSNSGWANRAARTRGVCRAPWPVPWHSRSAGSGHCPTLGISATGWSAWPASPATRRSVGLAGWALAGIGAECFISGIYFALFLWVSMIFMISSSDNLAYLAIFGIGVSSNQSSITSSAFSCKSASLIKSCTSAISVSW